MKRHSARINGIELAYSDRGEGEAIVLVHGFPLNRAAWAPQLEALSPSTRVIVPDLRGHGDSEAPLWHYTMPMFADDLAGLMDHLGIERAVMCGLSMGGYILFSFYGKYPERVSALILADTRAGADTPEVREGRFQMAQTAYRKGMGPVADAMMPKLLRTAGAVRNSGREETLRKIITSNPPAGIIGDLMAMAERPDSTPVLPGIKCPTLVIVGQEDVATPPDEAERMASLIPKARFEVIPEAAHLSNFENPEAFNRTCLGFLEPLSSG